MTWKEMLHDHVAEEAADHDKYLKIAEEAESAGCCHEAGVLRDIAHEEKTHHRLLKEMAGDMPEEKKAPSLHTENAAEKMPDNHGGELGRW